MKFPNKAILAVILLGGCVAIHIYSSDQLRVEYGYSSVFFPWFSKLLRSSLGSIPVSIGDFFYGALIAMICWKTGKFIFKLAALIKLPSRRDYLLSSGYKFFIFCCSIYIVFNIFWGINYDRKGIAWQLGLNMEKYSTEDLELINSLLVNKINSSKAELIAHNTGYPKNRELYSSVFYSYNLLAKEYPFLRYEPRSLKTSMWGWLGNYTGFTGYYNPFSGEAQLNTLVPKFLHPFIACHEVAHQLGYAKEMEANFVGYLAARASPDALFHYSVYLDLFTYANRNLFYIDSSSAKLYRKELDTAVVADLRSWADFNRRHRNPVGPVINWIYGKYLQGNRQPQGMLSYDEVTAFLIAYYKKFGRI